MTYTEKVILPRTAPCHTDDILYVQETWGYYGKHFLEADYFMYCADTRKVQKRMNLVVIFVIYQNGTHPYAKRSSSNMA